MFNLQYCYFHDFLIVLFFPIHTHTHTTDININIVWRRNVNIIYTNRQSQLKIVHQLFKD